MSAREILGNIRDFLDQNLTDVVIIDIEDYVKPKDFKQALIDANLFDQVWTPKKPGKWPTLLNMVVPRIASRAEQQRLIVMIEKNKSPYKWLLNTYKVSEETNFFYKSAAKFDCAPKRGGTGKSFFIVNHWINTGGIPDPVEAAKTNSEATLTKRVQQCIATRGKVPNAIAVNFTASGDLFKTVRRMNSAIARQSGVTQRIDEITAAARYYRDSPLLSDEGPQALRKTSRTSRRSTGSPVSRRGRRWRCSARSPTRCRSRRRSKSWSIPSVPTHEQLAAVKVQDEQTAATSTTTTATPPTTTTPKKSKGK